MNFRELLEIVGDEPIFETALLLAGQADAADLHRQLSRWTRSGKLYQLRRGLYALAPPFSKTRPHPFVVANRVVRSSYVTCQSALAFDGMIPEHVPTTTSVTPSRPGRWETPLGVYHYQHVQPSLFFGYRHMDLGAGQGAFVATPEKALMDLIYLQPGADCPDYLNELRLQHLDRLDISVLQRTVDRIDRPKLRRAAEMIIALANAEQQEYETL